VQSQSILIFSASIFLVSVPVFIEAPLVRYWPEFSVFLTLGLLGLSWGLLLRRSTWIWGDLMLGFAGSWLAGSIYWGWLRWEPLWHLPVEAIALPLPLWLITRNRLLVGSWFAVGSFVGTAITDLYFYLVDLMPFWRDVMRVEPELVLPIFQQAIAQVRTPWGIAWAIGLTVVLLAIGLVPIAVPYLRQIGRQILFLSEIDPQPDRSQLSASENCGAAALSAWSFSGAVLSTILVDMLFGLVAVAS
jgi:Protein of unknown function (DUF3120)